MRSSDGAEICTIYLPICDHQLLRRIGLFLGLFWLAEAGTGNFGFLSFDRGVVVVVVSLVFLVVGLWKSVRDQAAVLDLENSVGELSGLGYAYRVRALVLYGCQRGE